MSGSGRRNGRGASGLSRHGRSFTRKRRTLQMQTWPCNRKAVGLQESCLPSDVNPTQLSQHSHKSLLLPAVRTIAQGDQKSSLACIHNRSQYLNLEHMIEEDPVEAQSNTEVPDRRQSSPTISAQSTMEREKVQNEESREMWGSLKAYNLSAMIGRLSGPLAHVLPGVHCPFAHDGPACFGCQKKLKRRLAATTAGDTDLPPTPHLRSESSVETAPC